MKVKTFRNILILIYIAYIFSLGKFEERVIPLLFNTNETVWIDFHPFQALLKIACVPGLLLFLGESLKVGLYKKMTKKAYLLFGSIFAFLVIVPLLLYPARTEITAGTITKHNLIGQESAVYRIEDAEKVTAKLTVSGSGGMRTVPRVYLNFEYTLEFDDGFIYEMTDVDDDRWWSVVRAIDNTVVKQDIERQVFGKTYIDRIYEFDNSLSLHNHREIIELIMNR